MCEAFTLWLQAESGIRWWGGYRTRCWWCLFLGWLVWTLWTLAFFYFKLTFLSVLVCTGCRNQVPQTEWLDINFLPHSPDGQKSKMKVAGRVGLAWELRGRVAHSPCLPAVCWQPVVFVGLGEHHPTSAFILTWRWRSSCVHASVSKFPLFMRTPAVLD